MNKLALLALAFLTHGIAVMASECNMVKGESQITITASDTPNSFDVSVLHMDYTNECFDLEDSGLCVNIFDPTSSFNDVDTGCDRNTITKTLVELQTLGFDVAAKDASTYIASAVLRSFVTDDSQTLRDSPENKIIEFSRELSITIDTAATFTATGVEVYPNQTVEQVTTAITYERATEFARLDFKTAVQGVYKLVLGSDATVSPNAFAIVQQLALEGSEGCLDSNDNVICYQTWSATIKKTNGCEFADYFFDATVVANFVVNRIGDVADDQIGDYPHTTVVKSGYVCTSNIDVDMFSNVRDATLSTCDNVESMLNETSFYYGDDICLNFKVALEGTSISIGVSNSNLGAMTISSFGLRCVQPTLSTGSAYDPPSPGSSCISINSGDYWITFGFSTTGITWANEAGDSFLATDSLLSITLQGSIPTTRRLRKLVEISNPGNNAKTFGSVVGSISSRPRPGTVASSELLQGSQATSDSTGSPASVPNWAIALIVIAAAALSVVLFMKALTSYKSYRAVAKVSQNTYAAPSPTLQSSA